MPIFLFGDRSSIIILFSWEFETPRSLRLGEFRFFYNRSAYRSARRASRFMTRLGLLDNIIWPNAIDGTFFIELFIELFIAGWHRSIKLLGGILIPAAYIDKYTNRLLVVIRLNVVVSNGITTIEKVERLFRNSAIRLVPRIYSH